MVDSIHTSATCGYCENDCFNPGSSISMVYIWIIRPIDGCIGAITKVPIPLGNVTGVHGHRVIFKENRAIDTCVRSISEIGNRR